MNTGLEDEQRFIDQLTAEVQRLLPRALASLRVNQLSVIDDSGKTDLLASVTMAVNIGEDLLFYIRVGFADEHKFEGEVTPN
jgi:hypothetical protein